MNKEDFIMNYRKAFGDYELPIAFWYSEIPVVDVVKTRACFICHLKPAREGKFVSLNIETISCPGGKIYTGFIAPPPFVANFVSNKEHYKQSPELVNAFIADLNIPSQVNKYINFTSLDQVKDLKQMEGLVFFATPDVLSGLTSWVFYDTNAPDAVSVPFGSGCSSIIANTLVENQNKGYRTFLGMFDPSARPQVEENILTLAVPMSRFKDLYHTIDQSCLQGTPAWNNVKKRIENGL